VQNSDVLQNYRTHILLSEGHHKKYAVLQLTLVYYIFQIIGYIFLENSIQIYTNSRVARCSRYISKFFSSKVLGISYILQLPIVKKICSWL